MKPKLKLIQGGKLPQKKDDLMKLVDDVCNDRVPMSRLIQHLYPSTRERIQAFKIKR